MLLPCSSPTTESCHGEGWSISAARRLRSLGTARMLSEVDGLYQ